MVGDTAFDVMAAQRANIKSVGVTWCQTKRNVFEKLGTDYIIDNMFELLKILEG
jgi:phosphoglycolate phosphatase-like HAD superfamily hydrolase